MSNDPRNDGQIDFPCINCFQSLAEHDGFYHCLHCGIPWSLEWLPDETVIYYRRDDLAKLGVDPHHRRLAAETGIRSATQMCNDHLLVDTAFADGKFDYNEGKMVPINLGTGQLAKPMLRIAVVRYRKRQSNATPGPWRWMVGLFESPASSTYVRVSE